MMTLEEFLRTAGRLTVPERILVAEQALVMLEGNYAHLPLKTARYAVSPVQRLRLLLARLHTPQAAAEPEWWFHRELLAVYASVRDLHTRYTLPEPFASAVAHLGFTVKEYAEGGRRRFVVPPVAGETTLPAGTELLSWNGVPIERAVDLLAERMPGANPAARTARALLLLTTRSLGMAGPPDEEFVLVRYRDAGGTVAEHRETWAVSLPDGAPAGAPELGPELEMDLEATRVAGLRTALFAPQVAELEQSGAARVAVSGGLEVDAALARVFEARVLPGVPDVGHLRIRTFDTRGVDPDDVVDEFLRLLELMPPGGLILDVRGNPGGNPILAEQCLQALTARPVVSEPLQFLSTPLNLRLCRAVPQPGLEDLRPWLPSMEQAVQSGAVHSAGLPRTPAHELARVPQRYIGPVVLVTDGRVYSAADRFTAGFQDNGVGAILGADANTGAGGGNIWQHATLLQALEGDPASPYRPLPAGTNLSVAIRRTLRVGPNTGVPVEDFGVEPDEVHAATLADIMEQGADLMAHAVAMLRKSPPRRFDVTVDGPAVRVSAAHVDRADVFADDRPRGTLDLPPGPSAAALTLAGPAPAVLRVIGHAAGEPVAVREFRRAADGTLRLRTRLR